MNANYLIYLAERSKTAAEQRQQDQRAGELAAAIANLWHSLKTPVGRSKHVTVQYRPRTAAARPQEWCGRGHQWSRSRA